VDQSDLPISSREDHGMLRSASAEERGPISTSDNRIYQFNGNVRTLKEVPSHFYSHILAAYPFT
jgi:hypothetical protein